MSLCNNSLYEINKKKSRNLRKNKENSSLNLGSTQLLYGTSQTKKPETRCFIYVPELITNLQAMKSGTDTTTTSYLFYITLYED